ncbi:hypothetical protein KAR48_09605 [bacterium]|nr:hypothetical protein [bacterium]
MQAMVREKASMLKKIGCVLLIGFMICGCNPDGPNKPVIPDPPVPTPPSVVENGLAMQFESTNFQCFCLDEDTLSMHRAFNELEANYARILVSLEVENLPQIKVKAWSNQATFYEEMAVAFNGLVYQGATGYLNGMHEIRLLYPYVNEMTFVHEFVHVVSLAVNPTISNNPRWLWEAVAIYGSGDFTNPANLSYIRNGAYPTLNELNTDFNNSNHYIYQLGYVIAEYIVETWGQPTLVELIRQNGNVDGVLEMTETEFETRLYNYITEKYL